MKTTRPDGQIAEKIRSMMSRREFQGCGSGTAHSMRKVDFEGWVNTILNTVTSTKNHYQTEWVLTRVFSWTKDEATELINWLKS